MLNEHIDKVIQPTATFTNSLEGFLRLSSVLKIIPVSRSCLFEMVNRGEFARPVKLTARVTAWRVEDIRAFIASRAEATAPTTVQPVKQKSNLSVLDVLGVEVL